MEVLQMICIVIFSSSITNGMYLIKFISIPMILANSVGTAIFLYVIKSSQQEEERTRAVQTQDVLNLVNETLPLFRQGLTEKSCLEAAEIIQKLIKVEAVSITNDESVLAFVGEGSDHHYPSSEISTSLSKQVLKEGHVREVTSAAEIGCDHHNCLLKGAIVIPLIVNSKIVGTLKLYYTDTSEITFVSRQLAEGLGKIFSSQIELGKVEIQNRLHQDAEIKALEAQVNPHFLFNTLNTLSALIRVDSEEARRLLLELSHFFRANIQGSRAKLIPLIQELRQVKAYVELEQARFPNKYNFSQELNVAVDDIKLPPFLIQILVENAVKHAFGSREKNNKILLEITSVASGTLIVVRDNGRGISDSKLELLGKQVVESLNGTGTALDNLNKRLMSLFGDQASLCFRSSKSGTIVSCVVPKIKREGGRSESFNN